MVLSKHQDDRYMTRLGRKHKSYRKNKMKRVMEKSPVMVTHMTADGSSVPPVVRTMDSISEEVQPCVCEYLPQREENPEVNIMRKIFKYTSFALVVFVGQILISVSLKRYGYIEKDINELVAEQVVPQIQSRFVQTGLRIPQFNESFDWFRNMNHTLPTMAASTPAILRPGFQLAQRGAVANYPIVMVPGFVTSGLEVWEGKECAKHLFRQRLWGGVGMVQHWLMERQCVMEHMALDPKTGGDPENIRVRAASGFEAADYFAGNYWVWSKLFENLADIGYDGSTMSLESYDWRLSFPKLEERDGYLTKLKYKIEAFHASTGKKVVLTSHSLGGILVHYFFAWVTTAKNNGGGGGGKDWVDNHIHTYINIAGAHLGVPKAASALLSGEMSDTVVLGAAGSLIEQFMGRKVRKDLWNTWGSLWSMLPKGGDALWNIGADLNLPYRPNESFNQEYPLITMTDGKPPFEIPDDIACTTNDLLDEELETTVNDALKHFSSRARHSVEEVISFLTTWGGGLGPAISGVQTNTFDKHTKPSMATWHDISRTPLPHAPHMKLYCLYGVGLKTERSYYYKHNLNDAQLGAENRSKSAGRSVDPPFVMDTSVEDPENDIIHGVKYVDGDGSVPLLSLGYMCADAWRRKETGLNPGKTEVFTREYKHRQETTLGDPMRGGPFSADHVDIMGNMDMMQDFLRIVSDFDVEHVQDSVVSDIHEISKKINSHPEGGLKRRRRLWFGKRL